MAEGPQLARPFDLAVIAGAHGVAGVVPLVMAIMRLAVISFGGHAEVDEKPGKVMPDARTPPERRRLDSHWASGHIKAVARSCPLAPSSPVCALP